MVNQWLPEPPNGASVDEIEANDDIIILGLDASDTDDDDLAYEGYEPLPLGPNEIDMEQSSDEETGSNINNITSDIPPQNLPSIVPVDQTILREVWSAPAPECVDIQMDSAKANEVKMAMANFTLPSTSIPEWAALIPEEQWKEQLINRIQNMNESKNKS